MSEDNDNMSQTPTSELGSVSVSKTPNDDGENDRWRLLFETQNANMRALIQALQAPNANKQFDLPEFDPEKMDTDARSWCATADLCFAENPLCGGQLILAISRALKGFASMWLSQIAYQGMSWDEFKVLFTTRFVSTETLAGHLINLNSDKQTDKETVVAYASRMMTSLTNRWKDVSKEQIAVATVLSHISQFDSRLQRLAFTTDITCRAKLQQELHAFSYLKRKFSGNCDSACKIPDKRAKITTVKCFNCGMLGHKQSECRSKETTSDVTVRHPASTPSAPGPPPAAARSLVCFKCGKPGHIALRCTNGAAYSEGGPGTAARTERRVDVCVKQPPSGNSQA